MWTARGFRGTMTQRSAPRLSVLLKAKRPALNRKGGLRNNECLAQHSMKGKNMLLSGRLSRSDEKEGALGTTDIRWVASGRTDGPLFQPTVRRTETGAARCARL